MDLLAEPTSERDPEEELAEVIAHRDARRILGRRLAVAALAPCLIIATLLVSVLLRSLT
ncbi:hypothetical protein [Galbitalea soli]|uniref:Uncharacterized protein n=1 Tax=Galbitalea soli TaxID=1268042 RepID=A0A7C9TQN0_9MICO|nr:hypothetical protein [Galbitalea soli]NEM90860.1 hypothetical protein [Galbitalea soli]NYJ31580.1 hypothetical protein [Galbitalea soli]